MGSILKLFMKLTTTTGKTFTCDEVIEKDGVKYYKDKLVLWNEKFIVDAPKTKKKIDKEVEADQE